MYQIDESLQESVAAIMENEKAAPIDSQYRKDVTAKLIENQVGFLAESADQANVTGAGVSNFDPVLIPMVRRAMPKVMAFDIAGVQPMTGPTGLIFAMRSRYTNQTGSEAFMGEGNSAFSGAGAQAGDTSGFAQDAFGVGDPAAGTAAGDAMSRTAGEQLGTTSGGSFAEMAFSIEKTSVEANTRALKAEYSTELAHDLRKIHKMDAESELANILSTEIVAEIDRELLRKVNISAVIGADNTTTAGEYDIAADADGRWAVERWKGLIFQLELEANAIAIATRRGKGNTIWCSANVASALAMTTLLDYNPQLAAKLNVDVTGQTFAGILMGKFRVFVDPYATIDYVSVGYRGQNAWDAGVYYCPYVPLEMVRAVGEDSFQPKIGFKTRYGLVANPFAANTAGGAKAGKGLGQGENPYFRKLRVKNVG